MGTIQEWALYGPPRENERIMGNLVLYESIVANDYSMAYMIDDVRQRFLILWLREKPIGA